MLAKLRLLHAIGGQGRIWAALLSATDEPNPCNTGFATCEAVPNSIDSLTWYIQDRVASSTPVSCCMLPTASPGKVKPLADSPVQSVTCLRQLQQEQRRHWGWTQARPYSTDHCSSGARSSEVAALNKELDDFFGVAADAATPQLPPNMYSGSQQQEGAAAAGIHATWADAVATPNPHRPQQHQPPSAALAAAERGQAHACEQGPSTLTHVDREGKASMVDVGSKADTLRVARASARVLLGADAFGLVASNRLKKGDVLTVAQLAGIMGAKQTSLLIPLCHNILLSSVKVTLDLEPEQAAIKITSEAQTVGPTGVEMEALTAASVAALTVYDMCKAVSKDITVTDLRLDHKSGGKSGDFTRSVLDAS